jgi:ribosomal protein S27E
MAIAFRCTGCRCRIHVADRRAGTTVSCPRCQTRVVVPAAGEPAQRTLLEGREIERSLAALAPVVGGSFAEESFAVPAPDEAAVGGEHGGPRSAGVTLHRWAIYAVLLAFPVVAAVSFVCGCLWMAAGGR